MTLRKFATVGLISCALHAPAMCDWGKCLEVWAGHKPCLIENVTYRNIACTVTDNIVCDVASYGRFIGNQRCEPATDLSGFRVAYENLAFRRFRAYGKPPKLTGLVDGSTSPHSVRGLVTEDLPPGLDLEIRGDVRRNNE